MSYTVSRDEFVQLLSDLIRIPSVKAEPVPGAPFGQATVDALDFFLARAEADGFRVGRVGEGYAGYIEFGPEDAPEMIASICHLDVVPAGDWLEAFEPVVKGDFLTGRGSTDDKGPAVACYFAMKQLKEAGYEPKRRVRLILGLDEESGSECMKYYRQHGELPVCAITADADFPVIHAEKGQFQLRMTFPRTKQTGKVQLLEAEAGERANVVPGTCRLRWSVDGLEQEETYVGRAAHASTPEMGKNAIAVAFDALCKVYEAAGELPEDFVRFFQAHLGHDHSGAGLNIQVHDEVSAQLTFNAAVLRLTEDCFTLVCDSRYPVTFDGEQLIETLRKVVEAAGGQLDQIRISPPLYLPESHPLISGLVGVYNRLSGEQRKPLAIGGGTYARTIPNTVAFGAVFPGEVVLMHQTGETASLVNLISSVDYYREAFVMMAELQMPSEA